VVEVVGLMVRWTGAAETVLLVFATQLDVVGSLYWKGWWSELLVCLLLFRSFEINGKVIVGIEEAALLFREIMLLLLAILFPPPPPAAAANAIICCCCCCCFFF
jgi:hypothetical protein